MPLPPFRDDGWLPEGHHKTTWEELDRMRTKGFQGYLILDGSFISQKSEPGDFDTIFVGNEGVETILAQDMEAALLVNYVYCKQQGWGDIFYFSEDAIRKFPLMCRTDGFDYDKVTRIPKGVVEVDL